MTAPLLRQQFEKQFYQWREAPGLASGIFDIFAHVFSAISAAAVADATNSTLLRVLAIVWIGTRLRALGNIIHECAHQSFVKGTRANVVIGTVLSILDLRSFRKYRREHFYHHQFLGQRDRDPDYLGSEVSWTRYFKNFVPVMHYEGDPLWMNAARYFWFFSVLMFSLRYQSVAMYVLLPYVSTYFMCRVLSDVMDHYGIAERENAIERSRNHVFKSAVLNAIFLPRNDGYHLVHHVFPRLPVRAFPQTDAAMMAKIKV